MKRTIHVKPAAPQYSVITNITFAQTDAWFGHTTQDLRMDLIYPEDTAHDYPCIVWICGGAWLSIDKSAHLAYLSELARAGFVVASVQYRTSNEAKFPAQLCDVKAAIRYLRAHAARYHIDEAHIGVMGESAGGYLTCMDIPLLHHSLFSCNVQQYWGNGSSAHFRVWCADPPRQTLFHLFPSALK